MTMRDILLALLAVMPLAWAHAVGAQPAPPPAATAAQATSSTPAPKPTLGRLFYTPSQRATLDEMRRRPQATITLEQKASLPPAPEYVTLNGIVRRSDGTTTVWLNDKQVRGRESEEGLQISPARRESIPNRVTIVVPQTGNAVDLKVGQQLEVNSGEVKERYRAPSRPRPVAEAAAPQAPAQAAPRERRGGREREILRDLLDEMDRPAQPASPPPAPAATGNAAPKS